MAIIKDTDKRKISKLFDKELTNDVKLVFFTQEFECEFCQDTRQILEEVAGLSERITLEVYDLVQDQMKAKSYGVDKVPATVILGDEDYGIRIFGVPGGYEFTTLIEDIADVGRRDPKLPQKVLDTLNKIDGPVKLEVLVTPSCAYCPRAVRTAHRFAMASYHITAEMIDVVEFPFLAVKYQVQGVPQTVINGKSSIVGMVPESEVALKILETLGAKP